MTRYRVGVDIGGTFTDIVFLGEHGDLNIVTKSAYLLRTGKHKLMFAADSCNISPEVYKHVHRDVGDVTEASELPKSVLRVVR